MSINKRTAFLCLCAAILAMFSTMWYFYSGTFVIYHRFASKRGNVSVSPIPVYDEKMGVKYDASVSRVPLNASKTDVKNVSAVRSACPKLPVPNENEYKDKWQPVSDGDNLFLYSAFVDDNIIRVIGITTRVVGLLKCHIWSRNDTLNTAFVEVNPARLERISGGELGHRYTTTYVICPLPSSGIPYAVAIVEGDLACQAAKNLFLLYRPVIKKQRNFSACIPPVMGNYPTPHHLVQWIEMNRILGVQFFTFYNKSMTKNNARWKVFEKYAKEELLEILQWDIPTGEIHYGGQIASMHDCLYRNRKRFKYTGFFDLDELIIPRKSEDLTWSDMLKRLPEGCSYSFRSSFFNGSYASIPNDTLDREFVLENSYVKNGLKRQSNIFNHGVRSKAIVKPDEINTFGVHVTWTCRGGTVIRLIDPSIGMLHHYRFSIKDFNVADNTTLKYVDRLRQQLMKFDLTAADLVH